ncbi:MAG TPA: acetate--CoA ligase family protein [Alphaproteobacteria bacterium]|nr:acetate--CoA ligase family protein [Alphaproteobacteria bacterium]
MPYASDHRLAPLFRPRSIALIGASDRNPFSQMAADNLERFGFSGPTYMVNPRAAPAHGRSAVASCREIGEPVDAAYVSVPQAAVMDAMEDAVAAGIRDFVLVSSGFAELGGEGAKLQARLEALIREKGLNLLGPNSLGYINFKDRVALGALTCPAGPGVAKIAVVSASGSTGLQIANFANQIAIGLTHLVSTGNESGVDTASVVDFLIEDDDVKALAVFAETIRDPITFTDIAVRALGMKKAIVVLKVGRAPQTGALVSAHTGSLVGDDRVFDAMCDRYGISRVYSTEDLVITASAMANIGPMRKPAVGVVSISGGAVEMISDRASDAGVPTPPFTLETQAALRATVSEIGQTHNPLDLTGGAMRDPPMWERVLNIIARDPQIGLTICNFDIPSAPLPHWQLAWDHMVKGLKAADPPGPILTSYIQCFTEHGRKFIQEMDIPYVISGIGTGMDAIGRTIRWSEKLARPAPAPLRAAAAGSGARPCSEREALEHLAGFGVPVIPATIAKSAEDAVRAFRKLDASAVLKIVSADIQHKTEIGGVLLNLGDEASVSQGFDRIMAAARKSNPEARIDGVAVLPMRRRGLELFVGIARDPQWGPVLSLGMGGIWVEAMDDVALELLPARSDDIVCAFRRLKSAKLLDGYRGGPKADLEALADIVVKIAEAALDLGPDLAALEINPLLVDGSRIEALDALAVWGKA